MVKEIKTILELDRSGLNPMAGYNLGHKKNNILSWEAFMNTKIAVIACLFSLATYEVDAASTRKAGDAAAYKTGEKTGELLLQQWLALAKKDINKVIGLSEQIVSVSKAYAGQVNKDFLQGSVDYLKNKNIKAIAEKQKLDKHSCARVLTCYYYWESLISEALLSGSFDLQKDDKEMNALEKAAREVYGVASPEVLADLKKFLEEDENLADCIDMMDLEDDSEDEEDDEE